MSHAFSALAAKVLQNDLVYRGGDESRVGVVNSVGGMQECGPHAPACLPQRTDRPRAVLYCNREEEYRHDEEIPEGKAYVTWLEQESVMQAGGELVDVADLSVRARGCIRYSTLRDGGCATISPTFARNGPALPSFSRSSTEFSFLATSSRGAATSMPRWGSSRAPTRFLTYGSPASSRKSAGSPSRRLHRGAATPPSSTTASSSSGFPPRPVRPRPWSRTEWSARRHRARSCAARV